MVGGLPCEALLQLIQEILLDFASRNVTQAVATKLGDQVLAQQEQINLLRSKLECRQYAWAKASRDELREQHRALWAVLPLVNRSEMSV